MEIEKLKVGMIVKNYKEMCILLEENICTGNSKIYQLKEWERYFNYHKEGNKFIIDNIYENPKEKEDKRLDGINSIFSDDIQVLLLDLLAQSKNNGQLNLPATTLLNKLSMVNINYKNGRKNIPKLSELLEVEEKFIYDFYNTTQSSLKGMLETALNQLKRKSLIFWSKVISVCERKAHIKLNEMREPVINKDGKINYQVTDTYRKATQDEMQLILKTEKEVLKEMGYRDKQDIFINGLWDKYMNCVTNKLYDKANINYYYTSYEIIFNKEHILEELDYIEKLIRQSQLNQNIKKKLNENVVNRHSNCEERITNKTLNNKKINQRDLLISDNDYCISNIILSDNLIKEYANELNIPPLKK